MAHPAWCSPTHCEIDPDLGDVMHCSAPLGYRFTGTSVLLTLQRVQHGSYLGEQPPASYLSTITDVELHEQVTVEMTDADRQAVGEMVERLRDL